MDKAGEVEKREVVRPSTPQDLLDRRCPVPSCTFRTSKAGMRNLVAASHLVRSHSATVTELRAQPDRFVFRKVTL